MKVAWTRQALFVNYITFFWIFRDLTNPKLMKAWLQYRDFLAVALTVTYNRTIDTADNHSLESEAQKYQRKL